MDSRTSRNKKINIENRRKKRESFKQNRKKRNRRIRLFLVVFVLLFICYGLFIEPNLLLVNEVKLENKDIPSSFHGIKIVHFSDLHYGSSVNRNNINKIVKKINSLEGDIIVFTGDLIEDKYIMSDDDIKVLTNALSRINSSIGKYCVVGNHDFYNKDFSNILYDSSFNTLKNNYDIVYNNDNNPILIYGVDDVLYGDPKLDDLNKKEITDISYKILLVHEPDFVNKVINKYDIDLILSGHSHNGQIKLFGFDPIYTPIGSKDYYSPYYDLGDTDLYISNGIGTNFIDFRFGSIPSINLFRLNSK